MATTPGNAARVSQPGDSGVWFFIMADMSGFAVFFLVFMLGRAADPATYEASRTALDLRFGLANTLILLTSGAFMAQATRAAQRHNWVKSHLYLILTLASGLPFALSKILEWNSKVEHGIGLTTNEFFTYYFVFTGVHFLHFIVGVAVLIVLMVNTARTDKAPAVRQRWVEAGGAYWHMVDLLWIVLFAMLYLMRAA